MSDSVLSAFSSLPSIQFHRHVLLFSYNRLCSTSIKISPSFIRPLSQKSFIFAANLSSVEKDCPFVNDSPLSVDLIPITSEDQFDSIIAKAQQLEESIVILWTANWCRKCIYLKPKLEKLAADYYPRIRFFCVDVNMVPQKLVTRAGVTKMPTIQLWRDSQKQAEVIGGHDAWLVVEEVRKMIENDD